jgi:hypothetical protein
MGFLIGAPSASGWSLSTWGKLRRAAGQYQDQGRYSPFFIIAYDLPDVPIEDFNQEYTVGTFGNYFKSAATGSGWLKGGFDFTSVSVPSLANFTIPYVWLFTGPFPATGMDVELRYFDNDAYVGELTGETVQFQPAPPNNTFVITGAMATGSVNVPGDNGTPIITIGKLVQIT